MQSEQFENLAHGSVSTITAESELRLHLLDKSKISTCPQRKRLSFLECSLMTHRTRKCSSSRVLHHILHLDQELHYHSLLIVRFESVKPHTHIV